MHKPTSYTEWRHALDLLLTVMGASLALIGCGILIYLHWSDGIALLLGMQLLIVLCAVAATYAHGKPARYDAAVFSGGLLKGSLIVLLGIYFYPEQPNWMSYALWAALLIPWAMIAYGGSLWLVWIIVINLTLLLWLDPNLASVLTHPQRLWQIAGINLIFLLIWELFIKIVPALNTRAGPRLIAGLGLTAVSFLCIQAARQQGIDVLALISWCLSTLVLAWFYSRRRPDRWIAIIISVSILYTSLFLLGTFLLNVIKLDMTLSLLALSVCTFILCVALFVWYKKTPFQPRLKKNSE